MPHDPLDVLLFAVAPIAGLLTLAVIGIRKYVAEVRRLIAVLDAPDEDRAVEGTVALNKGWQDGA